KTLLRSWFMRNTVHIMATEQAFVARPALRENLVQEWNRWTVKTGSKERPDSWIVHYDEVLAALEEGPLSMSELLERYSPVSDHPRRILSRTVREMSLKGLVCNAEPRGPWYHDTEHTYADVKRWVPGMKETEESRAQETLMKAYLRAYGPATVQDYAYWTGMKVSAAREVLRRIDSELVAVEASGQKGKLYVPGDTLQELDRVEVVPLVRLLPKFDALIMGQRDKIRFMDEAARKRVFLPAAEVSATVLVDGRVEGVWVMKKEGDAWSLSVELFRELDEEHMDLLCSEIQSMKGFTGFEISEEVSVV
ncbi:AlkZ family DNA glycosylase, partial [Candidatus Bathyarchaeota archaeon]|nr:AlkZ family DNA glycosylase [Candidatus Bathyarchaeota archaeon]